MIFKMKSSYHVKMAFVFSFIMILMFFAYNYILLQNKNSVFEKDYIVSVENNVKQLVNNIETEVSMLSMISFSMVSNTDLIEALIENQNNDKNSYGFETQAKIEEYIASQLSSWLKINGIFIFSTTGDIFNSAINNYGDDYLYQNNSNYNYKTSDWYMLMSKNNFQKAIYYNNKEIFLNDDSNDACISYIRAIKDLDTFTTLAYLKIDLPIKEILKDTVQTGVNNKDYYVIKEDNDVLISNFDNLDQKNYLKLKNYKVITHNIEGTPWVMTYYASKENLITQKRNITKAFVIISIIGVLLIMIIIQYISYIMAKRIRRLEKAMEQVEKGNLDVEIVTKHKDDISLICKRFNKMVWSLKKSYQQVYEAEIETKAAHIKALQSQINPHFFYNTMECIDALSYETGNRDIGIIAIALSKNFRYAFKEDVISSLQKEVEHINGYINIMKIRYPEKFEVIYEIPENMMDTRLPRLSLQPIIENSILHGILKKRGKGIIIVKSYTENERALIKVIDNGVGIKDKVVLNQKFNNIEKETLTRSIGLINVNNRIKYYFGKEYGLYIESVNETMTSVVLSLPYN